MGLTKAQKHNRMLENVFNQYNSHQNSLPCEQLMNSYKRIATEKNISLENTYGYTVKQFEQLLKLGWN